MSRLPVFDPDCRLCPRLVEYREATSVRYPDYHSAPVPPFGDAEARLLIVGLAPGLHGANATGRPFTGDHAGLLLYRTLFDSGFSTRPRSTSVGDGLKLTNCRITNAVKCVPPQNKPLTIEIDTCNPYLGAELAGMPAGSVVLALGGIAHRAVLRALGLKQSLYPFGHGSVHRVGELKLLDSYHCSRYNTQTRRLTGAMFAGIFEQADVLLGTP